MCMKHKPHFHKQDSICMWPYLFPFVKSICFDNHVDNIHMIASGCNVQ